MTGRSGLNSALSKRVHPDSIVQLHSVRQGERNPFPRSRGVSLTLAARRGVSHDRFALIAEPALKHQLGHREWKGTNWLGSAGGPRPFPPSRLAARSLSAELHEALSGRRSATQRGRCRNYKEITT